LSAARTDDGASPRRLKRRLRRILSVAGLSLLTLAGLAVAVLLAWRAYEQHRIREATKITSRSGIESLEKVTLGGVEQWILIRGHDRTKPLLLFLHGGPGLPNMPLAHVNAALEREFVVVQWDQRGAGKSYSSALQPESLNIEQFVADTLELVQLLRSRFGAEKIHFLAHSWGTIPGALAVSRHPEFFHDYVGVSQVGDAVEIQQRAYDFTLDAALHTCNQRALAELKRVGPTPFRSFDDCMTSCKCLARFSDPRSERFTTWRGIREGLASPYYSLSDHLKIYRGMRFSVSALWAEISRVNMPQR
jgi:proline iminopeptidase